MYLGKLVELAPVDELYEHPKHPYTIALLSAVPDPDPRIRKPRLVLQGDVPSPAAPPSGCRFHTRCWLRERLGNPENCSTETPLFRDIDLGHKVACHWAEKVSEESIAAAPEWTAQAATGRPPMAAEPVAAVAQPDVAVAAAAVAADADPAATAKPDVAANRTRPPPPSRTWPMRQRPWPMSRQPLTKRCPSTPRSRGHASVDPAWAPPPG